MAASPAPDSPLDNEIASMREQIQSLERRRSVLSSTLLSSQNTLARIQRANSRPIPSSSPAATALSIIENQQKLNLENLHRTCTGVTAFRVKDPDPFAADNGKILGVRIEVSVKGKFIVPYYLLLNRPSSEDRDLRIHKHTVPPCIPLQALAAKYLPQTPPLSEDGSSQQKKFQDLHRLVRGLRQELVSHHMRLDMVAQLRREAGLAEDVEDKTGKRRRGKAGIVDVKALDVAAREIQISWADDSTARIITSRRGIVERAVVRSPDGSARMRAIERKVMAGNRRVEGVIERLTQPQGSV